jgi:hypothetical protein
VAKPLPIEPATALQRALEELATREATLASLREDRGRLLIAGRDAEVEKIDEAIAGEERAIARCGDRIEALRGELGRLATERAEREKAAALAEVAKRLASREQKAVRLEKAVAELGEALADLLGSRAEVLANWPRVLPLPKWTDLRGVAIQRELAFALYGAGRPAWDRGCAIPAPIKPVAVAGRGPMGIAASVAVASRVLMLELRKAPLLIEQDESEAA